MFWLKRLFSLRGQAHGDHEKPFLEHLEDLRSMITRMSVTLVVSMVVCFAFSGQLMELLLLPVDRVSERRMSECLPGKGDLPRPVDTRVWAEAQKLDRESSSLDALQREALYEVHPDQDLVFHARCVALLRAAMMLPEESRRAYLEGLGLPDPMLRQVLLLAEKNPGGNLLLQESMRRMSSLRPTETFMLTMKLSLFAGIVLSFPLLLLFLLQFVLPGMHRHERKVLWPALLIGFGLFLSGVLFSYFVVLPGALKFFYEYGEKLGIVNEWRIGEYLSFATQFTLLFGVAFELPVVVMVLVKLGLLGFETMSRSRSYAVVAIFILAAVLTPTPDPFTMLAMAMPMVLLYEACIWLAWFDRRKSRLEEEREAREAEERRAARASALPAPVLVESGVGPARPAAESGEDAAPAPGDPVDFPGSAAPAGESPGSESDDGHPADDGWHVDMPMPELDDTLGGLAVDFPEEDGGGESSGGAGELVAEDVGIGEHHGAEVEPFLEVSGGPSEELVDDGLEELPPEPSSKDVPAEQTAEEGTAEQPPRASRRGGRRRPRMQTGELPLFGEADGGDGPGEGGGA